MSQLALPIGLDDHAVFESFLTASNEEVVDRLHKLASGEAVGGCWLSGPAATGKTHLLQAVCDRAGDDSAYVPIGMLAEAGAGILDGLQTRRIVCLDDIDCVAGDAVWEHAVFGLYNELLEQGGQLVVSAAMAPRDSDIALPDLKSRLSQLPAYRLNALDDEGRMQALQLRAELRGLELPDETAQFLLRRSRRDMGSLYQQLDRLDREALKAQRRLTIPFVRGVLEKDRT